ncbi:MAG: riboflavin synthase [Actinomycetota bacterium]|nr:riboflavin synthase [Actinomycetota bacterium]
MFTGIIEELGGVQALKRSGGACELQVLAPKVTEALEVGDSIAVNGVCLTVVDRRGSCFKADVMPETLDRTNLGELKAGDMVNLERALRFSDRLGGHLVTAHTDGVGRISSRARKGNAILLRIEMSPNIARYLVPQGSVAVDGISLTIVDVLSLAFTVFIIPHTAKVTTLGFKDKGARVNIEVDIIGKYVEKILTASGVSSNLTLSKLREHGFI